MTVPKPVQVVETPCNVTDSECLESNIQETAESIAPGDPELGIDPTDPLFVKYIEGELPVLDFEFHNNTITGLGQCQYKNVSVTEDLSRLRIQYDCPSINMVGRYRVSTTFFISSRGGYTMNTGRYLVSVDTALKQIEDNGTNHLQLEDFTLTCELLGTLDLVLKRTDSTNTGLLSMANQYMRENYRAVAARTQDSVWGAIVRRHLDILNQHLMRTPVDHLFIL